MDKFKYTWGYVKDAALAKLDLSDIEREDEQVGTIVSRFAFYANEAMTQICSTVKPKYTHYTITVERADINKLWEMPSDFVSFNDDVWTMDYIDEYGEEQYGVEMHDDDYIVRGYNQISFKHAGTFNVGYNARWCLFDTSMEDCDEIEAPIDVVECIPSYIAHQCYKIDDDVKAQLFRNEYEIMLARINNTVAFAPKTIKIGGGW